MRLIYLTLLKINLPIPSLEKTNVVRSDNRFGKSNPGISATMKCFWIPTQSCQRAGFYCSPVLQWAEPVDGRERDHLLEQTHQPRLPPPPTQQGVVEETVSWESKLIIFLSNTAYQCLRRWSASALWLKARSASIHEPYSNFCMSWQIWNNFHNTMGAWKTELP